MTDFVTLYSAEKLTYWYLENKVDIIALTLLGLSLHEYSYILCIWLVGSRERRNSNSNTTCFTHKHILLASFPCSVYWRKSFVTWSLCATPGSAYPIRWCFDLVSHTVTFFYMQWIMHRLDVTIQRCCMTCSKGILACSMTTYTSLQFYKKRAGWPKH